MFRRPAPEHEIKKKAFLEAPWLCNHPEVDRIWCIMNNILGFNERSYSVYSRIAVDIGGMPGRRKQTGDPWPVHGHNIEKNTETPAPQNWQCTFKSGMTSDSVGRENLHAWCCHVLHCVLLYTVESRTLLNEMS